MTIRSLASGLARRLSIFPLRLAGPQMRAEAIERLSAEATVVAAIPGGELFFFAPSPLLRVRAAGLLQKEPDMLVWLDALPADAVLWDVGANVGVFSLYAAVRSRCRVVSFEPSAANFYVLSRNIQLNRLADRVSAYCVALAGATALGVLNLDSSEMGAAMSQFGRPGEASPYSSHRPNVLHSMVGFTIDDFIARFAPPFPTHLKLDVDGLEWEILQGATQTLADPRLQSAMVELSLTNAEERQLASAWLERHGLHLVSRGAQQGAGGELAANHLFVRAR